MPVTSLDEIAVRAETGWPEDTVQYSQVGTYWNNDDQPWDDGYRPDCSGFASMCMGLARPGLSTVTLVTTGTAERIDWGDLDRGDLVMLGGLGTGGNDGHVAVVVAVHRDRGTYEVIEQSGGLGPDRNTYRLGSSARPGMVPYRSKYVEDDMVPNTPALAVTLDGSTAKMVWNTPEGNGLPVDQVIVRVHDKPFPQYPETVKGNVVDFIGPWGTAYNVENLKGGQDYYAQVYARNTSGWSTPGTAMWVMPTAGGTTDLQPVLDAIAALPTPLTEKQTEDAAFRAAQRAETQ